MIDIEKVYHWYIKTQNEANREKYEEYDGWLSASSAGQCHRKQWYKTYKYDERPIERDSARKMRLGTVVHEDILEKAIPTYLIMHGSLPGVENWTVYIEDRIELPDVKVVGHLDLVSINPDMGSAILSDFKTVHSYKWRKMFGHIKNRDKNPSINYELQLGTYALGVKRKYDVDTVEMNIVWYNKDTSTMRTTRIQKAYQTEALNYWTNLKETIEEENYDKVYKFKSLVPGTWNSPINEWECNYCQFNHICKSPFITKKGVSSENAKSKGTSLKDKRRASADKGSTSSGGGSLPEAQKSK